MLGKTAAGLFWMFRYLERGENGARLLEAGFRIALTRSATASAEWKSILATSGALAGVLFMLASTVLIAVKYFSAS